MKKNLDIILKDLDGKDIQDGGRPDEQGKTKPLTAKTVIVNVLMNGWPAEQPPPDGNEKAKRWTLAVTLYAGSGEQELSPEEITTIKKLVGVSYGPGVVGPIYELLNK